MRKMTLKLTTLLLSFAILMSGTISLAGAKSAARPQNGKTAKQPVQPKQEQYAELMRQRAEAASRAKAKLDKIKARAAEVAAETRKKKSAETKVKLTFTSADAARGIAGSISDKATGMTILFESKLVGDNLSTRILNGNGATLIEYVEAERAPVTDPLTGVQSVEPVPVLRFDGIVYEELQGPIVDKMRNFATSPQGALLRLLAFYIGEFVPGEDMEAERRGLEVPFQAIQKFYATPAIDEYGGGDLKVARLHGANRRNALKDKDSYKQHEPLVAEGVDCEQFQCLYVDTHDFQLSGQGGYVVKSLSPRLSLSHNFARPSTRVEDEHHDHEAAALKGNKAGKVKFKTASIKGANAAVKANAAIVKPFDDASQVGDCFGRCGGGCGGWSHQWIGEITPYIDYTYCVGPDPDNFMPDCSTFCCSQEKRVTSYSGIAVHTAYGKVTLGSKAHDSCVRSLGGPAWLLSLPGMPCFPALLLAADCGIPGVGEEHSWSYIGGHSEGYDYYTGNCCIAIGPSV